MTDNKKYTDLVRWGIIGCGDVTEVKSGPAYQQTEGFELSAVMRRDAIKLEDYARRHGVKKYTTDAEELINDPDIDALYIATPPDSHLYYALKVADAGKPCCIEKPLSPSFEESRAICEAFQEKNLPLFVAYYRRSLPRFEQIDSWIKDEAIGNIRHISWHLSQPPSEIDLSQGENWRTDAKVAPGGYFDDLASHGLDMFVHLLGHIKSVYGISVKQQNLYSAKDAFTACWLHENQVTGSGSWNFGSYKSEDRVEIIGSKGKIEFSIFENNPLRLETGNGVQEVSIENPKNIQLPHVQNMKKHLFEDNYKHPSTGESATHVSWVMDKILGKL